MAQEEQKNYYAVLGIAPTATLAEIQLAYDSIARGYAPGSRRGSGHDHHDPRAAGFFANATEAYQELSDPVKRLRHDKALFGNSQGADGGGGSRVQHSSALGARSGDYSQEPRRQTPEEERRSRRRSDRPDFDTDFGPRFPRRAARDLREFLLLLVVGIPLLTLLGIIGYLLMHR